MRKILFIPVLINLLLIFFQIRYFVITNNGCNTPFILLFSLGMFAYISAVVLFIKYNNFSWDKFKIIQLVIVLLSIINIFATANGISISSNVFNYTPYANIILGVIGALKTRDKIHISFILWGVFTMIWIFNLYSIEDQLLS